MMEAVMTAPVTATPAVGVDIHRTRLREFLADKEGKFVGIDFVKQDGTSRSLNGRVGVRKHLAGGDSTTSAPHMPYVTLFDVKNAGYRAVNLETVSCVRAFGLTHNVVG